MKRTGEHTRKRVAGAKMIAETFKLLAQKHGMEITRCQWHRPLSVSDPFKLEVESNGTIVSGPFLDYWLANYQDSKTNTKVNLVIHEMLTHLKSRNKNIQNN